MTIKKKLIHFPFFNLHVNKSIYSVYVCLSMHVGMHVCECACMRVWVDMQEDNLSYWPLPSTVSQGLLYTRLPDLHFPRVLQVSFPACHGAQGLQILAFNWFYESELFDSHMFYPKLSAYP